MRQDIHVTGYPTYGVRVPAIIVGPRVQKGICHDFFEHTSLMKTILLRFCLQGDTIPDMGKRVSAANHLGVLLTEETPRPAETPELYRPLADGVSACRRDSLHEELTFGAIARAAARTEPTDLQRDYLRIREAFMERLVKEFPERLIRSI